MLSITNNKYVAPCLGNSGGISNAWVFDPADFTFTQAAGTASNPLAPYTAVALMAGATLVGGSGFYPVPFYYLTGSYKATHSKKNTSNVWAHELSFFMPRINSGLTEFIANLQAASSCSSLGWIIEDYNQTVTVLGEMNVGGVPIPLWRMLMDGSTEETGKSMEDDNGATVMIKGTYTRKAVQFTGGIAAIIALQETV